MFIAPIGIDGLIALSNCCGTGGAAEKLSFDSISIGRCGTGGGADDGENVSNGSISAGRCGTGGGAEGGENVSNESIFIALCGTGGGIGVGIVDGVESSSREAIPAGRCGIGGGAAACGVYESKVLLFIESSGSDVPGASNGMSLMFVGARELYCCCGGTGGSGARYKSVGLSSGIAVSDVCDDICSGLERSKLGGLCGTAGGAEGNAADEAYSSGLCGGVD